jgi:hypothetical protein
MNQTIAFYFGVFGYVINFVVDYGIWFRAIHTRHLEYDHIFRFFLLFALYGIIQFSYAILLMEFNWLLDVVFSLIVFIGLIGIGELAKRIGQKEIYVSRNMNQMRIIQIIGAIIFYGLIYWYFHDGLLVLFLILIGIIVECALEIPLIINKTRTFYWKEFLINIFFEFNMGIPVLYFMLKFLG